MKHIKQLFLGALLLTVITACTKSDELNDERTLSPATNITVSPFPAYADIDTRASSVGTSDAGKTTWATNDELLLRIVYKDANGNPVGSPVAEKLINQDGTNSNWQFASDGTSLKSFPTGASSAEVTAWYAPDYEQDAATALPKLKVSKTAGLNECFQSATATITTNYNLAIDFTTRSYSRLRVATDAGLTVALHCSDFIPAGANTALGDAATLTATTDNNGNAFFYGTWTEGSTMKISTTADETDYTLTQKSITSSSTASRSYVLDATLTTYNKIGDGQSESRAYILFNRAQLQDINGKNFPADVFFKLVADMDCTESEDEFTPIIGKRLETPIHFDGGGHTITGLTIGKNDDYSGLFGHIYEGSIKRLILKNPKVASDARYTGALVGSAVQSVISQCSVIADAEESFVTTTNTDVNSSVGGLVGVSNQSDIIGCSASIDVTSGADHNGGLIGMVTGGTTNALVAGSYATGAVKGGKYAGGLCGSLQTKTTAIGCYASGQVSEGTNMGSLAGQLLSTIWFYYNGTTGNTGKQGQGIGILDAADVKGDYKAGLSDLSAVRGLIVSADVQTKWDEIKGNFRLSDAEKNLTFNGENCLWKEASGGALKLWWEK